MTVPCGFDGGDCLSNCTSKGCGATAPDNTGVCAGSCDIADCGLDYGNCGFCVDGCSSTLYYNGVCDPQCNFPQCNYDNGDCVLGIQDFCAAGCTYSMYMNAVCDGVCDNQACYFDNGSCECSTGCTVEMLGNGICDAPCLNQNCEFDNGDFMFCSLEYLYVVSPDYPLATIATHSNIVQALLCTPSLTSVVYLLGDNFYLDEYFFEGNNVNDPLIYTLYAQIEIKPYYCSQGQIVGCYIDGVKPIITITDKWVEFTVTNSFLFTNVTFRHNYPFDPNCSGCDYCPHTTTNSNGVVLDDRGNTITPGTFLDTYYCAQYSNKVLFTVRPGGQLTLQVIFKKDVDFQDMRMTYMAIIAIDQGTVTLIDVTFKNIYTSSTGAAIYNYNDKDTSFLGLFNYTGGSVQLINNGYELIKNANLGNFMHLTNVIQVVIANVDFSYNIFSGPNSYFVALVNIYQLELSNSTFAYNAFPGSIISLDQTGLVMAVDFSATYQTTNNIDISNTTFTQNTGGSLISLLYKDECQSINITNNTYVSNYCTSDMISVKYQAPLSDVCKLGGNVVNENTGSSVYYPPRYLNITESTFTSNLASTLVNTQSSCNNTLADLVVVSHPGDLDPNLITIQAIQKAFACAYISLPIAVQATAFSSLFSLSSIYAASISGSNMSANSVPLISLAAIQGPLTLYNSTFSSNQLSTTSAFITISSSLAPSISYLGFRNNTYTSTEVGMISFVQNGRVAYTLQSSYFYNCAQAINTQSLVSLSLTNITVLDSLSAQCSLVCFSGYAHAVLSITSSNFSNSSCPSVRLSSNSLGSMMSVYISESYFSEINSDLGVVFMDTTAVLASDCLITRCCFENNPTTGVMAQSSEGKIVISSCNFTGASAGSGAVAKITGTTFVLLTASIVQNNTASSLFYVISETNSSAVATSDCVFSNNIATLIRVSFAVYSDVGSSFINNTSVYDSIFYITNMATVFLRQTTVQNNLAIGNGIIFISIISYMSKFLRLSA